MLAPSEPVLADFAPTRSNTAPPLARDLVKIAYQIFAFLEATGDTHINDISYEIGLTVQYICHKYHRPETPVDEASKGKARQTKRSSAEPLAFPTVWATDTPQFRRVIKAFSDRTRDYRSLIQLRAYFRKNELAGNDPAGEDGEVPRLPKAAAPDRSESTPPINQSSSGTSTNTTAEAFRRRAASEGTNRHTTTPTSTEDVPRRPNMADATFSPAQADQMAAIMANAMRMAGMNQQQPPQPAQQEERRTPQPPAFRARDVGYFDPKPDVPAIEVKENHNIYHNVFSFTNRLRVKADTMDVALLRQNLDACLLGAAEQWYTNELSHVIRVGLRNDQNNLKEWCDALEARFRDSPGKSLSIVEAIRYTVRDVRARKDPADYVASILTHSKNAGLATSEAGQVLLAYEHMDGELRRDMPMPSDSSTVANFISDLRRKKDIWYDIYSKHESKPADRGRQTGTGQYNNPFRPNYASNPFRGFGYGRPSMPNYDSNPYGNRPYVPYGSYQSNVNNAQQPQATQRQLPGGRQQLQITSGNANQSPGPAQRPNQPRDPNAKGFNRNPFRPRPYGTRAYHAADQQEQQDHPPPDDQAQYEQFEDAFYQGPGWQDQEVEQAPSDESEEGYHNDHNHDDQHNDESVEAHFCGSTISITCRLCKRTFSSGNQLHKHLKSCLQEATDLKSAAARVEAFIAAEDQPLIRSNAQEGNATDGYGFRGYRFATVKVCFKWQGETYEICVDTGCTMSLIDRKFLHKLMEEGLVIDIKKMPTPMTVRGLGTNQHDASEYARISIYLPGSKGTALITREVHIVDNLSANALIGIDIMKPEGMMLDLQHDMMTVGSCDDLQVPISTRTKQSNQVDTAIFSITRKVVAPHTDMRIPVKARRKPLRNLPSDRDFIFEPAQHDSLSVCAHVVDNTMSEILVRNDSDQPIVLPKRTKLGKVVEYEANGCYAADPDTQGLARRPAKAATKQGPSWLKKALAAAMAVTAAFNVATTPKPTPEIVHTTGVTMYDSGGSAIPALTEAVEAFPNLWKDTGNVTNIPESEWMDIPLVDNWQELYKPGQARVYPVGPKDREVIDEAFDKLHSQCRMEWTSTATPFSFPCFVIWKDTPQGPKGRVVVDIRALNKITVPDAYPVPSQAEILALIRDATHISTIDAAAFFYQWWVRRFHRYRLTVASHRGQETFNVPVMGYRNSPAYVQRMIDRILRPFRHFCRAYVDDIVIFSTSLEEHVEHLTQVFKALNAMNIHLAPNKAYLGYPSVHLLGQRVNALGLATAEEKLWAIKNLEFPKTLAALDKYLGLTGYLKQYVPYYTAIAKPLQERKTFLYQKSKSNNGNSKHKTTAARLRLEKPTPKELNAYHQLQQMFARPTMLHHHDPKRQLYVDLDASKEWGLAAHVYHVKEDLPKPSAGTDLHTNMKAATKKTGKATADHPKQKSLQPILFLSRQLKPAETRYWPTELEMAGIVWVVKKIRHLIEASANPTVIYTDHSAAVGLVRQTSLNTASVEKLNLRLVRASEYLQRFRIEIRHKPGKANIVPDALSRLASRDYGTNSEESELDALTIDVFPVSLIQVSDSFKDRVKQGYDKEPRWQRIMATVVRNKDLGENAAKLPYEMVDGLLYCRTENGMRRLCIPSNLEHEVFKLAHDEMGHPGYARTHEKLTTGLFIYNMATKLHEYIRHCPHCQMNQTPRHRPYGSLQPIYSPARPFHTITIDFILALPKAASGEDCVMSVTDKFSKAISLIAGEIRWGGELWAQALLDRLLLLGWGIPWATISDRDRRFMGQLWEEIFRLLKVDLLYSTAWHPQTDGMSERSNQTAEIALRYFIELMDNRWPKSLPQLSSVLNNSTKYSTTRLAPSEILFGFKVKEPLDLLGKDTDHAEEALPKQAIQSNNQALVRSEALGNQGVPSAFTVDYRPTHIDAQDAIDFASMKMKQYYDMHHQPIFFNVGDLVKLRLHRGYKVPGVSSKFGQQFIGPFKVIERIGRLAYRLQLPSNMRVHNVVSVAHLEPTTDPASDPYERRPLHPPTQAIVVDDDKEIDRLLRKRVRRIGRSKTKLAEYLVRWIGHGPEHDVWMSTKQLTHAKYHIDAYEAAQKEAVVKSVPENVPKAIAIIPPKPSLGMPFEKDKALPPTPSVPSLSKPSALVPTIDTPASPPKPLPTAKQTPAALEPPPLRRSLRLLQN